MKRGKKRSPDPKDHPVYWFAVLDQAIESADQQRAEEARRELERLGVKVTFRRRPNRKSRGAR